jgi:hypothetical protein
MKTFAQYLVESEQTFDYRIKIVGDLPLDFLKLFKEKLKKFDPTQVSDVKTTPVLAKPQDFPAFTNQRVNIIDATFKYPATPPQIQQIAELLGLDPNKLAVHQRNYEEGMDKELLGIENQKDLLTSPYPDTDAEQKKLKKDYSADPMEHEVVKNSAAAATWTVAGGKTPKAKTTNDLPQGVNSPMSKIKRPPKPATGFQK